MIKFAPQAMVLAVALYWSWPALKTVFPQVAKLASKEEAKKPVGQQFAAKVLSPKFRPFPKHNPFVSLDSKQKAAALARSAKSGKKQDGTSKVAAAHDVGLVLNATCIMGQQRMAIINGHVYKEKEVIPQPGDETPGCFVTAILPHEVLLSCRGEIVKLGYVNVTAKPAAENCPQKPAK
ncbi:MAG: hypothetical protein WCB27_10705 [Thermoguttaceae bacterium]